MPASIHPYNLNRGSGGFGCSTTFLASLPSLPSEAFTVAGEAAGLGDSAACCPNAEPEKDAYAATAMTLVIATRLNDLRFLRCLVMSLAKFQFPPRLRRARIWQSEHRSPKVEQISRPVSTSFKRQASCLIRSKINRWRKPRIIAMPKIAFR